MSLLDRGQACLGLLLMPCKAINRIEACAGSQHNASGLLAYFTCLDTMHPAQPIQLPQSACFSTKCLKGPFYSLPCPSEA